ncbi:uncharacterized protein LOC132271227 isoform X2 [Cornus florida]|uniref:uncharacterized protein LOC132271227 isoform X2 n=1 Tax=Cornus florida TaxID=4283 RepID=UPI00289C52FF|nr:uncharacterized protein LOC132271227 isoform X2 [Cornus florida]
MEVRTAYIQLHCLPETYVHTYMPLSCYSGFICSLVFSLLVAMVDFSPNLEDGEKWLPSDIYEEIVPDKFTSDALADNIAKTCAAWVLDEPIGSDFEISSNGYLGANGVPCDSNLCPFQSISGFKSPYSSDAQTQVQVESFKHAVTTISKEKQNRFWPVHLNEEVEGFVGSRGTGVFLPRITIHAKESEPVRGTGVFLQPSVADATTVLRRKRKSKKYRHTLTHPILPHVGLEQFTFPFGRRAYTTCANGPVVFYNEIWSSKTTFGQFI